MIRSGGTGGGLALRITCLAASVGLHVGLVAIGWESFGNASVASAPLMVTLADGPSAGMARERLAAFADVRIRPAGPTFAAPVVLPRTVSSASTLTVPAPVTLADAAQCAVPETTVVGSSVPAPPPVAPQEPLAVGVGEGGTAAGGSFAGSAAGSPANGHGVTAGPSGTGLVLATPRYASNPKPEYPRLARQNRWEGVVQLRALISAAGEVETLAIENSSGYQLLDSSAIDGVRRWRFTPARRGEAQVACEVRIPVAFRLAR